MIIRPAIVEDLSKIFDLMQEFAVFQKTPEKLLITKEQLLEDKDIFKCLVAQTERHEIVGFASFYFTYYSWSGKGMDLYPGYWILDP